MVLAVVVKGMAVFSFRFFWVGGMMLGLDAGILAKGAMRHFGKSRTVRSSRVPERFFVKVPGKISGRIVLGKIW